MSDDNGKPKRKRRARVAPRIAQPSEQPPADELERARRLIEEEAARLQAQTLGELIGATTGAHSVPTAPPPLRDTLAANVRAARAVLDISQDDLAAASGIGRKQISSIERGANPTIETVERLAKHLDRTPAELLTPRPRRR